MTAFRSTEAVPFGTGCARPGCKTTKQVGGPAGALDRAGQWLCCAIHPVGGVGVQGRDPDGEVGLYGRSMWAAGALEEPAN